ncbi:serine/threonine protein kinase [Metabacillus bambusae]|uniref:Protein kinase family protein n=1 Tax=Metabacillus bambusae TaxID=2795218 RepID=A0ABS3N1Q5_9BACI|nr:protein kinase family protein [Metabacillus bambusae]MBO1512207.1 protein kinase family protein [Metabacillus bambusae]
MNRIYSKLIEISEKPLKAAEIVGGKYIIADLLGKGSYGYTYLVNDQQGHLLVLKQLRKYKMLEESGRNSFKREANILKALNSSAFPAFYEHFEENHKQFIVMEHKKGSTFEEIIFRENISYTESAAFKELYHILHLVKQVHDLGYIHRDLRIPNILKNDKEYYIIDFGLARKLGDQTSLIEEKVNHLEKQLYREVAFKSDFYALGHFLLFLLYSSFEPNSKKKRSWEEELQITPIAKKVLRKMLQLDEPYTEVQLLINDVKECI